MLPKRQLKIAWLYHDILNIYGDRGNILTFVYRCHQRNIDVTIDEISVGDHLRPGEYDFIFSGGGQDRQQLLASRDLQTKKNILQDYAKHDTPMLLICGSYQLFGHYFLTQDHKKIPGISILDCYTVASPIRKIGNVVVKLNQDFIFSNSKTLNILNSDCLVGFENHSGKTYLNSKFEIRNSKLTTFPLGKVVFGAGNNGEDRTEGAVYRNVVGTYLHGSVLPKNPHLCDWLIVRALEHRYHKTISLSPLEDRLEWDTHFFCQKLKR